MTVHISLTFDRPIPFSVCHYIYTQWALGLPSQTRLPNKNWRLSIMCRDYQVPAVVSYAKRQNGYLDVSLY